MADDGDRRAGHRQGTEDEIEDEGAAEDLGEQRADEIGPSEGSGDRQRTRRRRCIGGCWRHERRLPLRQLRGRRRLHVPARQALDAGERHQQGKPDAQRMRRRVFGEIAGEARRLIIMVEVVAGPFGGCRRRAQQGIDQTRQAGGEIARRHVGHAAGGHDRLVEPVPAQVRRRLALGIDDDQRTALARRRLHRVGGAAAPTGRAAVPDRDHHVRLVDHRIGRRLIGTGFRRAAARQFEHGPRLAKERAERIARCLVGEILLEFVSPEGQHHIEGVGERSVALGHARGKRAGRHAVGALGQRIDQGQHRFPEKTAP